MPDLHDTSTRARTAANVTGGTTDIGSRRTIARRRPMSGRLLALWRRTGAWTITIDGTVTWWCSDDTHQRERRLDIEIRWPRSLWRPYCWWRGTHDPSPDRACVYCAANLHRPTPETENR